MVVPGTLSRAFCLTFGALYPSYASFKALKSNNRQRLVPWLMYWVVFGLFCSVEFVADWLIFWLPFYQEIKMIAILWFVLPQTQGSLILYQYLVHPYLCIHEREIDQSMERAGDTAQRMGSEFARRGLQWLQQTIISLVSRGNQYLSQHHPQAHRWIQNHKLEPRGLGDPILMQPGSLGLRSTEMDDKMDIEPHPESPQTKTRGTKGRISAFFRSVLHPTATKESDPAISSSFEELTNVPISPGLTTSDSPPPKTTSMDIFSSLATPMSGSKRQGSDISTKSILQEQVRQLEGMIQQMNKQASAQGSASPGSMDLLLQDAQTLLARLKTEQAISEATPDTEPKSGLFSQIRNRGRSSKKDASVE